MFKISFDPTWDYVPIVIWTELEITAAFACVSLPTIRVLLAKITPKRLKHWLSEVTHGSSHGISRQVVAREGSSKCGWHRGDAWIDLGSTERAGDGMTKGKIGLLPSAEASTVNSLERADVQTIDALNDSTHAMEREKTVLSDRREKQLPRRPVSVKSKFNI